MPSRSAAQARLMAAIAHGWKPAHMKDPPPVPVAREFNRADEAKRLAAAMRRGKR